MNDGHFTKGDPRAIERGKLGGAISGERRKRESISRWVERFPGITPEAAREIYEHGYRSGWQAGAAKRAER